MLNCSQKYLRGLEITNRRKIPQYLHHYLDHDTCELCCRQAVPRSPLATGYNNKVGVNLLHMYNSGLSHIRASWTERSRQSAPDVTRRRLIVTQTYRATGKFSILTRKRKYWLTWWRREENCRRRRKLIIKCPSEDPWHRTACIGPHSESWRRRRRIKGNKL